MTPASFLFMMAFGITVSCQGQQRKEIRITSPSIAVIFVLSVLI